MLRRTIGRQNGRQLSGPTRKIFLARDAKHLKQCAIRTFGEAIGPEVERSGA